MTGISGRTSYYAPLQVLLYSSNAGIRLRIKESLGSLPDIHTPRVDFVETATHSAVLKELSSGELDLAILDAEAAPSGGIGLAKQLKDELLQCPPILVITARADDAWLADWSRADAVVSRPIDPIVLRETVIPLLQSRLIR